MKYLYSFGSNVFGELGCSSEKLAAGSYLHEFDAQYISRAIVSSSCQSWCCFNVNPKQNTDVSNHSSLFCVHGSIFDTVHCYTYISDPIHNKTEIDTISECKLLGALSDTTCLALCNSRISNTSANYHNQTCFDESSSNIGVDTETEYDASIRNVEICRCEAAKDNLWKLCNLSNSLIQLGGTVQTISIGKEHVVILLSTGAVYAWGQNRYGACGVDATVISHAMPMMFNQTLADGTAKQSPVLNGCKIDCGWYHTALIDHQGKLLTCGLGQHGCLGHGNTDSCKYLCVVQDFVPPVDLPQGVEVPIIIDVSCGSNHTVALNSHATLFSVGWNCNGQLGIEHNGIYTSFQIVELDTSSDPTKICAGSQHTAVLTANGDVFVWGRLPYSTVNNTKNSNKSKSKKYQQSWQPSRLLIDEKINKIQDIFSSMNAVHMLAE